jgi:2-keto-myo-inositol isomerase
VEDKAVARDAMRDSHRVLVGPADRVGNIGQITKLLAAGCQAPLSFEPFAEDVHAIADIRAAVEASMAYVNSAALAD